MKSYKTLIFICIIVVILMMMAESNVVHSVLGLKNMKVPVYDLDGYYYNDTIDLRRRTKPKIFIHLPHADDKNLSIVYLNIKSVIECCGHKYDVIIFDNDNVEELFNTYNLHDDLTKVNYRTLDPYQLAIWEKYCKSQLLYKFGGVMMEPFFYFTTCPESSILRSRTMKILKYTNEGLYNSNNEQIALPHNFIVSPRKNKDLEIYMDYLYLQFNEHNKFQTEHFEKSIEHFNKLSVIDPRKFGISDANGEPIYYESLFSTENNISFSPSMCALYVNLEMIKKKRRFGWFLKQSPEEIPESNYLLGKLIKHHQDK